MNTLKVTELRVIAKELEIKGYGKMKKPELISNIEEAKALREAIDTVNKVSEKEIASKEILTKTKGAYGLNQIVRALEFLGSSLKYGFNQEQRFDVTDKLFIVTKSGNEGNVTVEKIFNEVSKKKQSEQEVAITSVQPIEESQESKEVKEEFNKLYLEQEFNRINNLRNDINKRQFDKEEIKLDIKSRMELNNWVLPVATGTFDERFDSFKYVLNGLANYGRFKKEYVSSLILSNFTDNESLLNQKMVETRDSNTKENFFSQFVTMYMLANNSYTHIEKEMNHVNKTDIIDMVFDMEFRAIANEKLIKAKEELALENPKFPVSPISDNQIKLLEAIKANYARIHNKVLRFSIEPTTFKLASAFLFFYQDYIGLASAKQIELLEKKGAFIGYKGYKPNKNTISMKEASELLEVYKDAPTYGQVRVYLNILNRNGLSNTRVEKDDDNNDNVKRFINKLYFENNISFESMKTIINTLINEMALVKLALNNDIKCEGSIVKSALKVSKLDSMAKRMYATMLYSRDIANVFIDETTEVVKKQSIDTNGVTGVVNLK